MKLASCPRCERHIDVDAGTCPFCSVTLGTTSGIARVAMVATVGLTLASCVSGDDGGSAYAGPGPTSTSGPGVTSSTSGSTGGEESGSSAGGTPTPAESSSSGASSSSGGDTTGGSDSGGQDYAGAAPRDPGVRG